MCNKSIATIATFHVVGFGQRGAVVLRQNGHAVRSKARLANMPQCLIGMEACVGAHHLSRKLQAHGHHVRLMPAKYVRAYAKGRKKGPYMWVINGGGRRVVPRPLHLNFGISAGKLLHRIGAVPRPKGARENPRILSCRGAAAGG